MHSKQDTLMTIGAHELLTANDCEQLIRSEACLVGYAWSNAEPPSPTMTRLVKQLTGNIRLAALIYNNLSTEEQTWMCIGILDIAEQIAKEGYLTKYAAYDTDDQRRGSVIAFWPAHVRHPRQFQVPRRFEDLVSTNFRDQKAPDFETA